MLRLFIRSLLTLGVIMAVVLPALPAHAATNPFQYSCNQGGGGDSAACNVTGADPVAGTNGILHKATELIALLAGIAAVLTMVWGGIQYITSEGNPEEVSKAKKTVIYAAIGLVVIVLGRAIINFVLTRI